MPWPSPSSAVSNVRISSSVRQNSQLCMEAHSLHPLVNHILATMNTAVKNARVQADVSSTLISTQSELYSIVGLQFNDSLLEETP